MDSNVRDNVFCSNARALETIMKDALDGASGNPTEIQQRVKITEMGRKPQECSSSEPVQTLINLWKSD